MKNPKYLMAKAWDDRLGCALFMEVIQALKNEAHPNTVYGVGTVQEEVGLRGATTSAHLIDPDIGFALEVGIPGDTPGAEDKANEKLGQGPVILLYDASMIPHIKLRNFVVDTARQAGIPLQFDSMAGGGTDAGRIHIHGRGVPSLCIAVPTRYIHSHAGIIHRDDYDNAVKLVLELVRRLDADTVAELNRD
jgi:endoglucanase